MFISFASNNFKMFNNTFMFEFCLDKYCCEETCITIKDFNGNIIDSFSRGNSRQIISERYNGYILAVSTKSEVYTSNEEDEDFDEEEDSLIETKAVTFELRHLSSPPCYITFSNTTTDNCRSLHTLYRYRLGVASVPASLVEI